MPTAQSIVDAALSHIGVIGIGQTPATDERDFTFARLQEIIGRWQIDPRYDWAVEQKEFAFGTSKKIYTIGPSGADFESDRPNAIRHAALIIVGTSNVRVPLTLIDVASYAAISLPDISSSFPTLLYYERAYPLGKLYPWPYPTVTTNKLALFIGSTLLVPTSQTSEVSAPPGYIEALQLTLAESICPAFGRPVKPELAQAAAVARRTVIAANQAPRPIMSDFPEATPSAVSEIAQIPPK